MAPPSTSIVCPSRNFLAFCHKSLIVLTNMSKNRLPQHPSHTFLSFMPFARRHSHGPIVVMTADASLGATCCIELPLKPEAARGARIPADTVITERETHEKRPALDCG